VHQKLYGYPSWREPPSYCSVGGLRTLGRMVSYNAQGHITKEWIVWTLGRIIVPLLVVYFIVKIVEWIVAGFRTPKHPGTPDNSSPGVTAGHRAKTESVEMASTRNEISNSTLHTR
jgi:hypothetical protein